MKDIRGHLVQIGDRVAYNRSGYMATGQVSRITTTRRYQRVRLLYKIVCDQDGETSKVKDIRSLVVIHEKT